jgi:site-specific recombinase XerD
MGRKKWQRFRLAHKPDGSSALSPYRLEDAEGKEVPEVNEFLDAQVCRGLSPRSIRAYGYSLLNFWKWFSTLEKDLNDLDETQLLDYIRFQISNAAEADTIAAAKTINHRITSVRCLYSFHCNRDLPPGDRSCRTRSHPYYTGVASPTGYLHPRRQRAGKLRHKEPQRLVKPLSPEETEAFMESLRTWRDKCIVGLMLLCGLRSCEVIEALLADLNLEEASIRICGKGDKERVIPLPAGVASLLTTYVDVERPETQTKNLFVILKGPNRGHAMTASGLRSLFRYHRKRSKVAQANAHRWRHTFGTEMAEAGISLPALMKLMGHSDINTTMLYVAVSAHNVSKEFHRVITERLKEKRSGRKSDGAQDRKAD